MTASEVAGLRLSRLAREEDDNLDWTGIVHVLHLLGFIQRTYPNLDNSSQLALLVQTLAIVNTNSYKEITDSDGKINYILTTKIPNYATINETHVLGIFSQVLNDCYMWGICKDNDIASIWEDYNAFRIQQLFGVKPDGQY